jgi:hypothetical protein
MLTQDEADALLVMKKVFVQPETISFPPGLDESYELISTDKKEQFFLDISRASIKISKLKFQNRARRSIVLVRLDIDGAPHTNPDGQRMAGTHIHLYKEGYEDKWAYPVDSAKFKNLTDPQQVYDDFCIFCNIVQPSPTQGALI